MDDVELILKYHFNQKIVAAILRKAAQDMWVQGFLTGYKIGREKGAQETASAMDLSIDDDPSWVQDEL